MEFTEHGLKGFSGCAIGGKCWSWKGVAISFQGFLFLLSLLLNNATRRVFFIACIHAKNKLRIAIDISFDGGDDKVDKREPHTKTRLTKWNISIPKRLYSNHTHHIEPPLCQSVKQAS
jgi:hypothetical protein